MSIGLNIPGLVPQVYDRSRRYNWILERNTPTQMVNHDIFEPDNVFTKFMYEKLQKLDNESLAQQVRFDVDPTGKHALVDPNGFVWQVMMNNVYQGNFGAAGNRLLQIDAELQNAPYTFGARVPTDDPRIDPVWRKCAELGIPVLIHTGEPMSFWLPHDASNERWLELKQFPNRKRDTVGFVSFEDTMAEQHRLFRRHPDTIFINAHLGWLGHDLDRLGRLLDELPNVVTGLGAVLAELGRQPRAARDFLIRHQDRVLMGKDIWNPDEFATYFRTLETVDEYFDYYRKRHAHWKMYGLELPDEVLKKIYYKNALRVIPGLDASAFPD